MTYVLVHASSSWGWCKRVFTQRKHKNNYYQNTCLRCSMFSHQPKSLKASAHQFGSFCTLITTMGTTIKLYQSHQNHDQTCGKRWVSSAAKDTWKKTEEKAMGQQNWRVWYCFTIQLLGCPLCQEKAIGSEKRYAMPKHFFVCSIYTYTYVCI